MLTVAKVLVSVGGILAGIVSIGLAFFSFLAAYGENDSARLAVGLSVVSVVAGLVGGVATGLGRAWGAALVAMGCGAMAVVFVLWGPSSTPIGLALAMAAVFAIAVFVGMRQTPATT